MSRTLEFYFDLGSPASYLAHTQLPGLAKRTGARIEYRPMLLGGVFKATGNRTPLEVPAKGRHLMEDDLPRFVRRYAIAFAYHPDLPINTLGLMRGALVAEEEGCFEAYVEAIFRGMWVDARDMADAETVAEVLAAAGLDAGRLFARVQEQAIKDKLIACTEEAVSRGVFGAPTIFVGQEMFFGQDRLDFVEQALPA